MGKVKIHGLTASAVLVMGVFAASQHAMAEGTLALLTWEGYSDDVVVAPFTEKTGCVVEPTYVSSNDEIIAKTLASGSATIDLVSPSNDATMTLIDAGAVEAIDKSKLPHLADYFPVFQSPSWLVKGDELYGVPYGYGFLRLVLDSNVIPDAPASVSVLWDERLKGKLAMWDNLETLYVAARHIGVKDVYNMTDEELAKTRDALIALKPNIRKFWTCDAEFQQLYMQKEVVGGNTTELAVSGLWTQGADTLKEVLPKEGSGGWSDSWMIVKGASENPCVYAWLDWISSPESQALASKLTGYAFANAKSFEMLEPEALALLTKLGTGDPEVQKSISWWQPVPRRGAYLEIWNQVKAETAQ
ncbi:PotD/PotF family extracellular solute-binding protein [Dongia sp.]|uniref:ABC transporter substrate-binding protein n=1 Tax=Dongia sp. TaxID=1977262 RepID=UPI0035AE4E0A